MRKYRRRAYRKKPAASGSSTLSRIASVANTALRIGKFAAAVLNVEKKYYDTTNTWSSITNSSNNIDNLCLMGQGTTATTRIGNSVKMKNIEIKYNIYQNGANTTPSHVRVYLIQDRGNTAYASPAVGDVLENTSTSFGVLSPLSRENPGRFHILGEHEHRLMPVGTGNDLQLVVGKFFVDCSKLKHKGANFEHLTWDESGSAQADMRGYPLYLMAIGDDASNGPLLNYYSRLRFIDN